MDTTAVRKIKPYLGKTKESWSKHLGTAAAIERVYGERDNLIPNLKIRSFEYGRTAALIQNLLVETKNRWRSLHFYVTFKLRF
jgi:hypothetical protein